MVKLSVLLLTYNRWAMLTACLDSVLQTTVDCEVVVADDASTDGTGEFVRAYTDRDPRIRYFRHPTNVGTVANAESAVKLARGEYLALMSDDDSVEPGNYERKVAILDANPAIGAVYSLACATDEHLQNKTVIHRAEYFDYSYIGGRAEFSDLMSGNYIPGNSVVFRRALVGELGLVDQSLPPTLSDWDLWLRLSSQAGTAFINEPLVNIRMHGGGMSTQLASDMAMGMIAVWRKWLVDRPNPPALDRRIWERMEVVLRSEVQRVLADQPERAQACLVAFESLRQAAAATGSLAFARRTRRILARSDSRSTASLIWTGPVWAVGGLGSDLRGIVAAADAISGVSLRLEELNSGVPGGGPPQGAQRLRLTDRMWTPIADDDSNIRVWQAPLDFLRSDLCAASTVARVAFEDDMPAMDLLAKLDDLQGVWLPNQFQRDALIARGVPGDKLRVLPTCVDVGLANAGENETAASGTGRSFNFLSMVHLSETGWEIVLQAFIGEFRADEDVALVLLVRTQPGQTVEHVVEHLQRVIQGEVGPVQRELPLVSMRVGALDDDAVNALIRASQVYVEPRPSTWGRGALEAMARGVPVAGARIGPNVELFNRGNSYTVSAEPTPRSLGRLMRQAFSQPEETRRRGRNARVDVAVDHSPAAVGKRLRELVDELSRKPIARGAPAKSLRYDGPA